jgi:hypothetical protein
VPSQKNLEKTAKKAYRKAKDAVEEAQKAAAKVDRKARTKAKALGKGLEKSPTKTSASKEAVSTGTAGKKSSAGDARTRADALYTPPLPHAITTEVAGEAGRATEVDLSELTTIQLRSIAKSRGLTGYTRLPKALLVERLRSGEPTR